jgi:glycosyltransferase involved in cell wall biosynthesis
MPKAIHLIPYDGIGGVEVAAKAMADLNEPDFEFEVQYLFPDVKDRSARWATFNPLRFIAAARALWRQAPDVLIVSLWRCAIVGVIVRLLNRRTRLVVFLHNSADAHFVDWLCTRTALYLADAVWSDSKATANGRLPSSLRHQSITISYLVNRLSPLQFDVAPGPVFAFWGRLSPQKQLDRALRLFALIRMALPDARFRIIGPDGGELEALRSLADQLAIAAAVEFIGPLPFGEIPARVAGASFFLQTSLYEGMCLSVTEAMQLGLVPVVTPVGEVGRYCVDGVNALVINEDEGAVVSEVVRLLGDVEAFRRVQRAAVETWSQQLRYKDSVLAAIRTILQRSAPLRGS